MSMIREAIKKGQERFSRERFFSMRRKMWDEGCSVTVRLDNGEMDDNTETKGDSRYRPNTQDLLANDWELEPCRKVSQISNGDFFELRGKLYIKASGSLILGISGEVPIDPDELVMPAMSRYKIE